MDINPAHAANARGAPIIRIKAELKRLERPRAWSEKLLEKLTKDQRTPRARTLVAFAGEDLDTFFHSYYLHASLPDVAEADVLARWGRPFVVPLLRFTDGRERYGVVHLDQARFRYFEVSFGEIEELHDAFRPLDPGHWRESSEAKVGVAPGIPARGGVGKDRFVRRKDAWTHRFYKEVEQLLERAVSKSGVDHLFVLGPAKYLHDFIGVLVLQPAFRPPFWLISGLLHQRQGCRPERMNPASRPRAPRNEADMAC